MGDWTVSSSVEDFECLIFLCMRLFYVRKGALLLREWKGSQKRYLSRSSFIATPVQSDPLAKLD
jgi:hypothetical protein